MSSSVGYYYSAAEVEAERVRALRADLAALRVRFDRARHQATALSVGVPKVRIRAGETSAELTATIGGLRAAVEAVEGRLDTAWSQRWRERIRESASARTPSAAGLSAADELAADRARTTGEAEQRAARARESAMNDARRLVEQDGPRCDPADLERLTEELGKLARLEKVADVRAGALGFALEVKESVVRRKTADVAEEVRAALLTLVPEAPEAERDQLAEAVRAAVDPETMRNAVHQAVERADVARCRSTVAVAAAEALTAAGCTVGDDFATLLADRREAVARLDGDPKGYGVLVRLPDDGARIMAAVVRSETVEADADRDVAAQRGFCDVTLPKLVGSLDAGGVKLGETPFLRLEPGRRAVPAVDADRLPRTRKVKKTRAAYQAGTEQRQRERRDG